MNNEHTPSLRDTVLADIEKGDIKMRPKWYFALETALLFSGIVGVALLLVYIASLMIFSLRQNGALFLPTMGFGEIGGFLMSLPWILVLIALIFILLLQILVRKYEFAYGRPLLYSALVVLVFAAVGGIALDRTNLQSNLFKVSRERHLLGAEALYSHYGEERLPRVVAGTIVDLTDSGYILKSERNELITVIMNDDINATAFNLKPGDIVSILGDCEGMTIRAAAIRRITRFPEFSPNIHRRPQPCLF